MRILYTQPTDTTNFDLDRFVKCLKRYDSNISELDVEKAVLSQPYDPMHVSCLVSIGTNLIADEESARKYYEEHKQWYDSRNFERLRRITGYLVGSLERWNDGKRAEERERVKHSVGQYSLDEKAEIENKKRAQLDDMLV